MSDEVKIIFLLEIIKTAAKNLLYSSLLNSNKMVSFFIGENRSLHQFILFTLNFN